MALGVERKELVMVGVLLVGVLLAVLNQTLQPSPITTSPIIVAFSARKHSLPISGVKPLTGIMRAIVLFGYRVSF